MTTIDPDMQRRLSSFSRWWKLKTAQIGTALDSFTEECKVTPPTKPTISARHKRSYDEAEVIRIPASIPVNYGDQVEASELWKAWARGEKNVSLYSGKGTKPTLEEMDAHHRDPNVIPGPLSEAEAAAMAQAPLESRAPIADFPKLVGKPVPEPSVISFEELGDNDG